MSSQDFKLMDAFLAYADTRIVSIEQIAQAENLSFKSISEGIKVGLFPVPVGEIDGIPYWKLGDIARWRGGSA